MSSLMARTLPTLALQQVGSYPGYTGRNDQLVG
jgi:hypothetical protein